VKNLARLLLAAIATVLLAELVLRLLPVPGGMFAADPDPAWPVRRLVPGSPLTASFGWDLANAHHSRVNNLGYAAPFDYRDGAQVGVLIGDSYAEGLSNEVDERLQSFVADDLGLPRDRIYSLGTSGGSLAHYLGVAQLAGRRFRPQWATFLITARDFVEGFDHEPGFYHWATPPETIQLVPEVQRGSLAKAVRGLALSRYLRMNLKYSLSTLFSSGLQDTPKPVCRTATLSDEDRRLLDGWVVRAAPALRLPPDKVVLVFDTDRTVLYDTLGRAYLADAARAAGYRVIDTGPIFAKAWTRDHVPFDRSPLDAHWSPYANKLVAAAVAATIQRAPAAASNAIASTAPRQPATPSPVRRPQ
jgi:hypothetical protein